MNTYLIERTNKETGKTRTELVDAPFLALAFLEQETEYGKGYTYRLAGHLTVSTIDDYNKAAKDNLARFQQYQKSMAESSYTTPFTSLYRDDQDMAQYVGTRITKQEEVESKDTNIANNLFKLFVWIFTIAMVLWVVQQR